MGLIESLNTPQWTVLILLVVLAYFYRPKQLGQKDIPVGHGGLPLIGHVIPFLKDACKLTFDLKKIYGPIYAVNIAGQKFNVLTDVVQGKFSSTFF